MIDDTSSDYEGQEDTNMDWKKKGFDKHERLTLKINMEEAIRRNANKKLQNFSTKKIKPFKKSSKKIKNKIKTSIYDDDEDEEDYILTPAFSNLQRFSLERLLTPKEKKQLEIMEKEQNITPPEKLQIQQVVEEHIHEHIKEKQKPVPQKENIAKTEELQNVKESNFSKDEISDIFTDTPQKSPENGKEENKTDNKTESKIFDDKELKQDLTIEDLLDDTEKQEKDMRSLILEKSGRAKPQHQKKEKEENHEQKSAEIDFKNIKDTKEHER